MLERRITTTSAPPRRRTRPAARPKRVTTPRAIRAEALPSPAHRSLTLLVMMTLCGAALLCRLVFWQVMQHGHLSRVAAAEHAAFTVQQATRGRILDAQGDPLATNMTMHLVYAVPRDITDPAGTARQLAPLLHLPEASLQERLTGDEVYVQLAPGVDDATARKIEALGLSGIGLDPVIKRAYPEGTVASQMLGYVNIDGHGNNGLEQYYDGLLAGKAGLRSVLKDTAGHELRLSSGPSTQPRAGADLSLSIDGVVQSLVEDELNKAVKAHKADGGTAIVMDPRTGFILGMASTPSYNPNDYSRYDYSRFVNPAISDQYEPGSTFKIITMAAGLDAGVITPQSAFDDTGTFTVAGIALHNWNNGGFGWENMTQVLQHSANVGASWVANRLGTSLFYKYVRRFRIGQPTGVDLEDEGSGALPLPGQKAWTIVNLYTNSFGQGLATTPLQMVRAVGAVANGGVLMKPQIVKRIVYRGHVIVHRPVTLGRVISAGTARTLTTMLVHSAIGGEASLGLVKGYDVAAKTGTANVADAHGQYIQGDTIASIVGYAPAYNPRFVVLVKIDHPRDTPWGSMAAAPVLHDLLQELFMYYHIPPSPNAINR